MKIKRPILKPCAKDKFELVAPYAFNGIVVPIGFKTNGANIPRVFWSIFPPNSPEYLSAVVIHDYLCETAQNNQDRKEADEQLRYAMSLLGCHWFKVIVFYWSVRLYHILRYW